METFTLRAIKPLLKRQRITQREFARRIQMDEAYLSRLLNRDDRTITLDTLQRIADGLDISVNRLVRLCSQKEETK